MSVMDDVRRKEPEFRHVEFCLVHRLRERWSDARRKLRTAEQVVARSPTVAAREELAEVERTLEELREEVGGQLLRFTFRSVERTEFDRIKGQHRPSETDRTAARKENRAVPEWADTFQAALVAAACTEVRGPSGTQAGLSVEEAGEVWTSSNWNEAERAELFHTALAAYVSRTEVDGATLGEG